MQTLNIKVTQQAVILQNKDPVTAENVNQIRCVVELDPAYADLVVRESIAAFCERDGDQVTAGSRTNMQYAAYVEFGTGPVGDEKGTPLDSELGIVRKHEPWTAYIPGYGFRRLKGRLPALFMYNGMQEMQPVIAEHYGTAIQEAIK